jgi:hypothetical protein
MAVYYTKINESSATGDAPDEANVSTSLGINAPGGPVEFLIFRMNATFDADPCLADVSNLVRALRVTLNGDVVFDYRTSISDTDSQRNNNAPGRFGYFLNSVGGRAYENPAGTTTRTCVWSIPIGRSTPSGVNRYEIQLDWSTTLAGAAIDSSNISWWLRFNDAIQTTTTVAPATSFSHSASIEQVIVRVPQNVPGVVSGILVQNATYADQLTETGQGIRINALGDYGFTPFLLRSSLSDDALNGIMYADAGASTTQQSFAVTAAGAMFIPVFGLAGGDIALQVDSAAQTTRTYTPVITNPVGANARSEAVQTETVMSNPVKSILSRSEN